MREIKFRAWDKKHKWMDSDPFWIDNAGKTWEEPNRRYDTPNQEIESTDDLIVMQFTGLHDKNGKEIYEGDVCEIEAEDGDINRLVVKYGIARREMRSGWIVDIPCFYFELITNGFKAFPIVDNFKGVHDLTMLKVVGNIYEQPEKNG